MDISYDLINKYEENKVLLYNPEYEYIKTPKNKNIEVEVAYENNHYVVKKVYSKGGNKIPLNGLILSFPNKIELKENDSINILNYEPKNYVNALITSDGKRLAINVYNNRYYGNDIALFDRQYTIFTLVYQNYYEMIIKLDSKVRGYVISSIKHKEFNNKVLGREIDKGSYVVLSNDSNDKLTKILKENEEVFLEIPLFKETQDITFKYTEYNPSPSKKENFDATYFAFRAADTCMIYDINGYSVDKKTRLTGTNPWGYEVAVNKDGVIVDSDINVKIPVDGYVISGVSDYYLILRDYFKLGGHVTLDKKNKLVKYHDNHMECRLCQYEKMNEFVLEVLDRVNKLYDLNKELIYKYVQKFTDLKEKLVNRKVMIENSYDHERYYHLQRFEHYYLKALDYYHQLYKLNIEPSSVEVRACWHAPTEKSLDEVINVLETLKASNFNEILVGAIDKDGVIYKSKDFPICKVVKGYFGPIYQDDYLLCLTTEAKKRDIKVQVLVNNFFTAPLFLNINYDKYSKLLALDYNGHIGQNKEGEITLFFDPTNEEAHELLLSMYQEILEKYDISGFQLDYIRYCIGNDNYLTAFGYNEDSVERFKKEYHYEGDIHELVKDSKIYSDFCDFRRNGLTSFVSKVKAMVNKFNNIQLTLAVVSEYEIAYASKLQDWTTWAKKGYIDGIYLMAYHLGDKPVYKDCVEASRLVEDKCFVYGGVAPIYNNSNINIVLPQLKATKDAFVDGYSLFAYHSFPIRPDLYYYYNNNGPYTNKALVIYESKEKVLKAYCDEILDRYNRLYSQNNYISKEEIERFISKLASATNSDDVKQIDYIAHPYVRLHLEEIKERVIRYLTIKNNL